MSAKLTVPGSSIELTEGSVVTLNRSPGVKWVLHHGWYRYSNRQYEGWYFSSIPDKTIMPVNNQDLLNLTVIDSSSTCPGPCPPPGPYPPGPCPPYPGNPAIITEDEKRRYEAAFISVPLLFDRDSLNLGSLPDGKIVRVNDVNGSPKYYRWSKYEYAWRDMEGEVQEVLTPYAKITYVDSKDAALDSKIDSVIEDVEDLDERVTALESSDIPVVDPVTSTNTILVYNSGKAGKSQYKLGDDELIGPSSTAETKTVATEMAVSKSIEAAALQWYSI